MGVYNNVNNNDSDSNYNNSMCHRVIEQEYIDSNMLVWDTLLIVLLESFKLCFVSELFSSSKIIKYQSEPVIPRGLINKGNWCYINAVSFLRIEIV